MTDEQLEDWRARALRVEEEVSKAIVGQRPTIRLDRRFARRAQAATDLYWIAALMALVLLAVRFAPQ